MWTIFRSCLIVLVVLLSVHRSTRADTIVVPPFLADAEGNQSAATVPAPPAGLRFHILYPASGFSALPADQRRFVQMAFRPDRTVTGPRTLHFNDYELRLSTTTRTPGTLSRTFANNIGDDETIVFSGDLDWQTDGSGPPQGPRPFDYVVDFQTPFVYDPSQGNLLVDMLTGPAVGIPSWDAQDFPAGYAGLIALSRSATVAEHDTGTTLVAQFVVIPEPSSVVYIVVLAIALTTMAWWRKCSG